jgi:hypothetical protein
MKNVLTAVALAIAIPSAAYAQAAPAPEKKMECCEKMKAEGKECCCKDMAKKDHAEHQAKQGDEAAKHKH